MKSPFLAAALGILSLPAVSHAFTYALTADADAYINGGASADTTFGGNSNIVLKNGAAANNFARKGYVRFDISTIPAPITDAVLSLAVSLNDGGGNPAGPPQNFTIEVFGLADGDPGENWDESTISWNNAPANDTASGSGFLANAVSLGTFSVSNTDVGGSIVTFNSSLFTDFLNNDTDGLSTLMFRRNGGNAGGNNNLIFRSLDNQNGPAPGLAVTIPEPSRAGLLLIGIGCAVIRRRR